MKLKHLTLLALFILPTIFSGLTACGQKATPAAVPTAAPPTPFQKPATDTTATFEAALCPFQLPPDQEEGKSVECGYLVVPEDRADPTSPTIRLAVAIFHHPEGATEPAPIVYLSGGPGGSSLELLYLAFDNRFVWTFAAGRDVIFLDQRGVGRSEPALDCPAVSELTLELMDNELDNASVTDQEIADLILQAILACGQDLSAIADLSSYNSAANAADINDLRLALGYDRINLWGTSYGTRLALEVMRDYPEGLRSVVLDSVYPPDVNLYLGLPANMTRAFDVLFDSCAADAACAAAYPDLRAVFFDTVERLNANPAALEFTDALTRESFDALLTGDALIGTLFQFLYITEVLPSLPQIIYDASQDRFGLLTLIEGSLLAERELISLGMQLSVQCNEEFAFSSPEEFEAIVAEYPELAGLLAYSTIGELGFKICQGWDSGQADRVANQPVVSEVPTLLMAGQFDPITPPSWAQRAAETLPNGYFFEYPGVGHGASAVSGCPHEMMMAFWDDPARNPDDACIVDMAVKFSVPDESAITLEPFVDRTMGISGVAPSGWVKAGPGIFTRSKAELDVAALIAQAAPISAETLLEMLSGQIGLDEAPENVGERQANGLTWTLYAATVQGLELDIALTESDGLGIIVLLQSVQSERDALYQSVFLPVVDALAPIE